MSTRGERLSQIKLDIFSEILDSRWKYANFTPEQKIRFVERAFNNVNAYYSNIPLALNPKNTKFGFMIGRKSTATTFGDSRAIGFNIHETLCSEDPMAVYEVMFHEFQHVWHMNASLHPTEQKLPKLPNARRYLPAPIAKVVNRTLINPARNFVTNVLKPFMAIERACLYHNPKAIYTSAKHDASPNEMSADFFAFKHLSSVFREAKLKSSNPVRAQRLQRQNARNWRKNVLEHASAVANFVTFGKLFQKPIDRELKASGKRSIIESEKPLRFLSAIQLIQVISQNPELFTNPKMHRQAGNTIIEYVKQHGDDRHTIYNFFGKFSHTDFKRYAQDSQFARYDVDGKLIDVEELFASEYLVPTQSIEETIIPKEMTEEISKAILKTRESGEQPQNKDSTQNLLPKQLDSENTSLQQEQLDTQEHLSTLQQSQHNTQQFLEDSQNLDPLQQDTILQDGLEVVDPSLQPEDLTPQQDELDQLQPQEDIIQGDTLIDNKINTPQTLDGIQAEQPVIIPAPQVDNIIDSGLEM